MLLEAGPTKLQQPEKATLDLVHCKTFGYLRDVYYYAYSLDPAGPVGFGLFIPSP